MTRLAIRILCWALNLCGWVVFYDACGPIAAVKSLQDAGKVP